MAKSALGYRTKAVALPNESLANSSELGMEPLMERVLFRRRCWGLRTSWSGCSAQSLLDLAALRCY